MKNTLFSVVPFVFAVIVFPAVAEEKNPLQGIWEWVNIKNSCMETYIFDAANTGHITSGEETSNTSYTITKTPSAQGYYEVNLKIEKDNGGKDCGESVEDNTGETYKKFVMFHPSGNQYVSCDKEDTSSCVGPFQRQQ
ncbi:MAG TPA: hypothetical protein PL131_11795 [Methylotenera sp.]|nr:hypothetical protein [Methylotenera sp.]HPH06549.1 hypothetical protein [Methylotenera sp.]HPN01807.1 hypothetical protein [Methylotenera sp.]